MQGVPEHFISEKDRAQFRHLAHLPGVELYQAHIEHYAFEPHTHEAFGIGAIEQGAERFRYRGAEHLAPAGSLTLMNPDEIHTGRAETPGGWRYQMIYLEPDVVEQISGERNWSFHDVVRHHPADAGHMSLLLNRLWRSTEPLEIDGLLLALLTLGRRYARTGHSAPPQARHRFSIVQDYLRENLEQRITLAELATLVDLSPYHFLRQFKAQYHVTPMQMLMAYRLFAAKQMLDRGIPAAHVAAATGMTDQAHLTRAFTQRYGITPARYQKQVTR